VVLLSDPVVLVFVPKEKLAEAVGTVVVAGVAGFVPKVNPVEGLEVDDGILVVDRLEPVTLESVPKENPVVAELVVGSVVVELFVVFDELPKVNPDVIGLVLVAFDVPKVNPVVVGLEFVVLGSTVVGIEFKSSDIPAERLELEALEVAPKVIPVVVGLEFVVFDALVSKVNPVVVPGSAVVVVGLELAFDALVPKVKLAGVKDGVLPDILISPVPVVVLELAVLDVLVPKVKPAGIED